MAETEAEDDAAALRTSYALCRRLHAKNDRTTYLAARLFAPAAIRPHADALQAYFFATDIVADEGGSREERERAFERWSTAVLAELRSGRSDHPVRRALVHTARVFDLEPELFERFQAGTAADSVRTADFETFEDLRGFMREVAGTAAVLAVRLLGPASSDTDRVASLMGEVHQLVDIFEDFPIDLPRQRLYLPLEDLDRCGLSRADVFGDGIGAVRGAGRAALDALIRLQVERGRAMLREATALLDSLPTAGRPIIAASLGLQAAQLSAVERRGARVLRDGTVLSRARVLGVAWPHLRGRLRLKH